MPFPFFNKGAKMKKNGGWVFISHSHQDIELVRRIRNHLEGIGFEPLLFYLKCLSDASEIEDLIKREINEREWFIYADSPNARKSNWVKTEREYIESLTGKKIFTIDLSSDIEAQLGQINHIARQMKVFISYSRRDTRLMHELFDKLMKRDMQVYYYGVDTIEESSFFESIAETIEKHAREKDGFVVLLITEAFANSRVVREEIKTARKNNAKIVPVYVGKATLPYDLLNELGDVQGVHLSEFPTSNELERVVENILNRVEYYSSDYKNTYGYRSARTIHLPPIARIDNMTLFECESLECLYIPDTVIYITADAFEDFPGLLVKCTKDSYAHAYCIRHGIKFELIPKE